MRSVLRIPCVRKATALGGGVRRMPFHAFVATFLAVSKGIAWLMSLPHTCAGRYYKSKAGLQLGPGAFIAGLEYSTGVKCEVVGKPSPEFFHGALHSLGMTNHDWQHTRVLAPPFHVLVQLALPVLAPCCWRGGCDTLGRVGSAVVPNGAQRPSTACTRVKNHFLARHAIPFAIYLPFALTGVEGSGWSW